MFLQRVQTSSILVIPSSNKRLAYALVCGIKPFNSRKLPVRDIGSKASMNAKNDGSFNIGSPSIDFTQSDFACI